MTDIILNQLYPGGVMKQLADAAGGVTYDQYAPGGCVGQLYTAADANVVLDQYAEGGPLHQIELEIEGSGGGDLDWVPDGAKIHIDLVGGDPQGRAWVEGTGEVAVDTLLGADANTSNMWSDTEYDAAGLTADGYVYTGTENALPPGFIGGLRDGFVGGGTLSIRVKQVGASAKSVAILTGAANGNDAVQVDGLSGSIKLTAYSFSGALELSGTDVGSTGLGAVNGIAVTLVADRLDMSMNGETGVTAAFDGDDRPVDNPFVAAMMITQLAIQSITLYDPLPSTAGLSELSEIT